MHLSDEAALESGLRAWSEAEYTLANHSWSNRNMNHISASEFEAEFVRNQPVLEGQARERDWR